MKHEQFIKFCLENIHDKPDNITIVQRSLMIKLNTHNRFYLKQVISVDVIRLHLQQLSAKLHVTQSE